MKTLEPAHNSLKAHVLYRWLEFDESQGRLDKQRFETYLKLPRSAHYVEPTLLKSASGRRYPVDLNFNVKTSQLGVIRNDEPLVRRYLLHFLRTASNYRAYSAFIRDDYLKLVFAEAKITSGQGNPEKWYSMISPNQYQQLKDRVDIEFAASNPKHFKSDDDVKLDLHVKNVDKLIVKVYEINTLNFYRDSGREVNTDIQLDGLIPNDEFTFEYEDSPFLRERRSFTFPKLDRQGVFVIDFIGNGKSSRTVVRKGNLNYLVNTIPSGQVFQILDDQQKLLKKASLWMGGRNYDADDEGNILVPFSTRPGRQAIVLTSGGLSSLQYFDHQPEQYQLSLAIHFDRESLLDRNKAVILLRPSLTLNGLPVSPSLLENIVATVTTTSLDGVNASTNMPEIELTEAADTPLAISVPDRLANIRVELMGTITDHNQKTRTYAANHQVNVNGIERTDKIEDIHLSRLGELYLLQLLGKTGEPVPHRSLNLELRHEDFRDPIRVQLATNEDGLVELGPLPKIVEVSVSGSMANSKSWPLLGDRRSSTGTINFPQGKKIRIPHMLSAEELENSDISLYELRGSTFAYDWTEQINVESNFLEIRKLPPGDYSLRCKDFETRISVTQGEVKLGYVVGDYRRLELRKLDPLQIAEISANDDTVKIKIDNASEFARVHVYATRFQPAFDPFETFSKIQETEPLTIRAPLPYNLYMSGRKLGDELQYVLDRNYAKKFPGNMLERPSLLLNSWPVSDTQTSTQTAQRGEAFNAAPAPSAAADSERAQAKSKKESGISDFANLNFLSHGSLLLANLKPNKSGEVQIAKEELESHQHLHVIALDPLSTVYRSVALSAFKAKQKDLRLVDGMDAKKHYMQRKETSILAAGETFELADITTAKFDTYDSLQRVFEFYSTISSNKNLAKFKFALDWPSLSSDEKLAKYSEFASHELNFFLFKKDPNFFDEVIRPNLANKHDKTFLDHWLLEEDLTTYFDPWNFAQLNTVERVLLAERIAGESEIVRRLLADQLALIPDDLTRENVYFETAIAGQDLKLGSDFGLVEKQRNLLRKNVKSQLKSFGVPSRSSTRRYAISGKRLEAMKESRGVELGDAMFDEVEALVVEEAAQAAEDTKADFARLARQPRSAFFADDGIRAAGRGGRSRGRQRLFEALDKTKEWAENNYYQLPIKSQVAGLITPGDFWLDYAARDQKKPFFSVNWTSANRNFSEMMFALSVLDLPFEAEEYEPEFDERRMTITAKTPMVVFHRQIRETESLDEESPILIKQNYYRANDRYQTIEGKRRDKFVSDEFLTHVVYGCQVVLTNPTSSQRQVQVLLQIPHASIATSGGKPTKTVQLELQPYSTQTQEYYFYFPDAGKWDHFPAHVSEAEELLGYAQPNTLNVVETPSQIDESSWDYISQFASNEQVVEYLEKNNLLEINLSRIAFRMNDKKYFTQVTNLLNKRHIYNQEIWAYGLKHNDRDAMNTYLKHRNDFLSRCGLSLDSDLIDIDPVHRKTYQLLDYKPLVNARAHQLGSRRQILNDRFYRQYHNLLGVLQYRAELTSKDRMELTYYLLLQDRIDEALTMFSKVQRSELATKVQYDYFAAYLDCFQEEPQTAREIVTQYVNYSVPKWQLAFASIKNMLDEVDGKDVLIADPKDRTQNQTVAADQQPNVDLFLEGSDVLLDYRNIDKVNVNYYLIDLELLFSRNPFVQKIGGQFAHIRPNETQMVSVPEDQTKHRFELPADLRNRNVLVEVEAAGITKSKLYFSNSLTVQMSENFGQLKVVETRTGRALPKTYVKVYAQSKNGQVKFFKDGYTDLRGRFDYASLSTNELDSVNRFSLLVLSDSLGGLVKEAKPPKR